MGQYHYCVNLDKREFIHPHKLACGLKLWEQLASHPSTGTALIVLLASASNGSGGGDLYEAAIVGSWRGNRIAFVGDYDEGEKYSVTSPELTLTMTGQEIYGACSEEGWRDVSLEVCAAIEKELDGRFTGTGWREFQEKSA